MRKEAHSSLAREVGSEVWPVHLHDHLLRPSGRISRGTNIFGRNCVGYGITVGDARGEHREEIGRQARGAAMRRRAAPLNRQPTMRHAWQYLLELLWPSRSGSSASEERRIALLQTGIAIAI